MTQEKRTKKPRGSCSEDDLEIIDFLYVHLIEAVECISKPDVKSATEALYSKSCSCLLLARC